MGSRRCDVLHVDVRYCVENIQVEVLLDKPVSTPRRNKTGVENLAIVDLVLEAVLVEDVAAKEVVNAKVAKEATVVKDDVVAGQMRCRH